ncbi:MAG: cyclic nucleotide-binding domain-containing protein [Rhodospirillaceae bacterium]
MDKPGREMRRLEFPEGYELIRQSDLGDQAWLVEKGRLEVLQRTPQGQRSLALIGPGAIVGEMALIDHGPRTASVVARTDVVCLELSREVFERLIRQGQPLAGYLLESLVAAIRRAYGLPQQERGLGGAEFRSVRNNDKILDRRVYSEGHRFFNQGDPPTSAFLIQTGRVSIRRRVDGEVRELAQLGPGRIFGELALIQSAPRRASAVALERTVCEVIRKELFDGVIASMPPILRALTKIYVTQLSTAGQPGNRRPATESLYGEPVPEDGDASD